MFDTPAGKAASPFHPQAFSPKAAMNSPSPKVSIAERNKRLHEARGLYFDRRYRACAAKSAEHLNYWGEAAPPLAQTYLHYLTALSYDALARDMHHLSMSRPPTIELAEKAYSAALEAMPAPLEPESTQATPSKTRSLRMDSVFDSSETPSKPGSTKLLSSVKSAKSSSLHSLDTATEPENEDEDRHAVRTSKSPASAKLFRLLDAANMALRGESFDALHSPSKTDDGTTEIKEQDHENEDTDTDYEHYANDEDDLTFLRSSTRRRMNTFNADLADMANRIRRFRSELDALKPSAGQQQVLGPAAGLSIRFAPGTGLKGSTEGEYGRKMTPEEMADRIMKGRARGWKRERFDPKPYQELCELALSEL